MTNEDGGTGEERGPNEVYCKSCGEIIKEEAEICPHCGVRQRAAPTPQSQEKNPGLAAVASALVPGLGQIYNGQILKGIVIMILMGISILLAFIIIGIFTSFILWVYAVYDAYDTAKKINAGEIIPE